MRYRNRRYRRRMHRGILILLPVLTAVFLVSCVAGANPLWVRGVFGLDLTNYGAEPTEAVNPTDGELAASLCDMVEILTANSIYLHPFGTASQAVAAYRDAILNDMLRDNYLLYTGSSQSLSASERLFPQSDLSTLIPTEDFENTVYRYFGTASVRHKDGEVFTYLKNVRGYTAPLQAWESQVGISVQGLEETAHTYRMTFTLSDGENVSQPYTATFAKRDDGSLYFYSLEQ